MLLICGVVLTLVYSPEFSANRRDDINFLYIFAGQVEANTLTQTRESTASCGFFVRWPICLSIFVDGQFKTMLLCAPILRKLEVKQQSKVDMLVADVNKNRCKSVYSRIFELIFFRLKSYFSILYRIK